MRVSQNFGDSIEANRDERFTAHGGTYPGDPWVVLALRPDDARSLAGVLSHETGDAGFMADAANLMAAADWAEGVDEDEDEARPGVGLVVVFDKDKDQQAKDERRRRELWYDRPRGGSVTS